MTLFDQTLQALDDALLQWQADGQPTYAEALAIEEKRNAPPKDLVQRRRDIEYKQHLKQLEIDDE